MQRDQFKVCILPVTIAFSYSFNIRRTVQSPQTTLKELNEDLKISGIEVCSDTISRALRRESIRSHTHRETPIFRRHHVHYADDHLNRPASF